MSRTSCKQILTVWVCSVFLAVLLTGCASTSKTVFINPEFPFVTVERVAVIPFENLSSEQGIAEFSTRYFVTEILASRAFDVIEPGEVSKYLTAKAIFKTGEISVDQIKDMGKTLNVQALIFGSIGESSDSRSGSQGGVHVLSLNCRMVSAEVGNTVWSASVATGAPGFFARLFGVSERTRSDAVRIVIKKAIKTLVK